MDGQSNTPIGNLHNENAELTEGLQTMQNKDQQSRTTIVALQEQAVKSDNTIRAMQNEKVKLTKEIQTLQTRDERSRTIINTLWEQRPLQM